MAIVLAATCLTAKVASAAGVTGTKLTAPFPPSIAYPLFSDYTQVDLTSMGTIDWLRLGEAPSGGGTASQTGYNEKATGTAISGYAQTGGSPAADTSGNHFALYSDGTAPVASGSNGNQIRNVDSFTFNVQASDTTARRLDVFLATLGNATGTFTATLLNASNQPLGSYTDTLGGSTPAVYQIDFTGNSLTDHLAVSFTKASGAGIGDQIAMSFATVSVVPEPMSLSVLCLAGGALIRRRRSA
jgi:hypothetical protein